MTAARQASDALTRRLIDLARQGIRPRCGDYETSHYWTSEHEAERKQAAQWCTGCPMFLPCGQPAEANQERWGVWGGRDRTVRPGKAAAAVWLYLLLASSAGVQLVWMIPLAHRPAC